MVVGGVERLSLVNAAASTMVFEIFGKTGVKGLSVLAT